MSNLDVIYSFTAILLAIVGIYFLLSSLDNLFIEALYLAWRIFYRPSFLKKHRTLTEKGLLLENSNPLPSWLHCGGSQKSLVTCSNI